MSDDSLAADHEVADWDQNLEAICKLIIHNKCPIKVKDATEVGKRKVDYFRGKDFCAFMLAKKYEGIVSRKCKGALAKYLEGKNPSSLEDCEKLGNELIEEGFIMRAEYSPVASKAQTEAAKKKEKENKKGPDRLVRLHESEQRFDPEGEGFYILRWQGSQFWNYLYLAGAVGLIVAGAAFQAWPLWLKIGAWYCLVALLTLYFGLEMCRMTGFATFWLVGYEFWIFPNLNDEYCGFVDSFKPFYSFERRRDSKLVVLIRFGVLAMMGLAVNEISKTHSLSDLKEFATGSYMDIVDWGKNKVTALPGGEARHIPKLAHLEAEQAAEEEAERKAAEKAESKKDEMNAAAAGQTEKAAGGASGLRDDGGAGDEGNFEEQEDDE